MDIREKRLASALVASDRTRRVLVILQTYAVLLVVVCLNATDWGGYRERRALNFDARDLYSCDPLPAFVKPVETYRSEKPLFAQLENDVTPEQAGHAWAIACAKKIGLQPHRAEAVATWIIQRHLTTRDLDAEMDRVEGDIRANFYTVPIPLVGIKIDVNTFSLVGAAGHFLLLFWLLLSIHQERVNLTIIKREDEPAVGLVLQQMLFYPADNRRAGAIFQLMRAAMIGGVLAPIVPVTIMACNDMSRWSSIGAIFPSAHSIMALELVFVVLGLGLAAVCLRLLLSDPLGETLGNGASGNTSVPQLVSDTSA